MEDYRDRAWSTGSSKESDGTGMHNGAKPKSHNGSKP
jgi:hypothetical protein